MKKLLTILLAVLMVCTLAACSSKTEEKTEAPVEETKGVQVAIVTDVGQLMDKGFNQGTYEGAVAFAEAHGMSYDYYQPANGTDATDDDRINAMRIAIENGAEVIVTPGFLQETALKTVCAESPEVKFVFVDGWNMGFDNLTAICYHEEESGFLAGYAAVKDGYTKLGGTFGGAGSNPACNRFAYGYVQGIEAAASELDVTVDTTISFLYGAAFSASPELQTQISGWYANGTEIVFSCGGSMLQSVKAAAEENDGKIIGVDVDQAGESDRVVTSAVKGLAASVELVLNKWADGKWDGELADKTSNLGAADNATGLPTEASSWRFNSFTVEEYNELFAKVASGELVISSDVDWAGLSSSLTHVNFLIEE